MRRKMLDSTIHSSTSGKLFKGQVAKKLRELLEIRFVLPIPSLLGAFTTKSSFTTCKYAIKQ